MRRGAAGLMLRWTAAGAVSEPTAVQIRLSPRYPGRVRAGAPSPQRSLTEEEVDDNVRWFVAERVGPRTPACTTVVLSAKPAPPGTGWESSAVTWGQAGGLGFKV